MNQTFLLALLSRCQQMILEDTRSEQNGHPSNGTVSSPPAIADPGPTVSSSRKSYDNAYFYILFVMFFYSFLAVTLFKNFIHSDTAKKDPYEEFISTEPSSTQKLNAGPTVKFDFEEESSL